MGSHTGSRPSAIFVRALAVLFLAATFLGGTGRADAFSYDPAKIDGAFLQEVLAAPTADHDVIVRAAPGATSQADRAGKAAIRSGGRAKHALGIVGGASARLKGTHILKLTRDRDVDHVVKDEPVRATYDPSSSTSSLKSTGVRVVGAPDAWQKYGATGRGIGVAVMDSGVFPHPDLAGRIAVAADFTGATAVISSTPLTDGGGHGTHVAGIVAGDGASSGGQYMGVAPNARIVDVRVIDASGNGSTSNVLRGMQWLLANRSTYNVRVANLSFGTTPKTSYKSDVLATAVQVLTFAGITVVASAGNAGAPQTISSPGYDPYVITVGAYDDNQTMDRGDDSIAPFSSQGATPYDSLPKPDLVAPGRRAVSLLSPGATLPTLYPERIVTAAGSTTPQYFRLSGSSMAAPMVAGAAALLLERNATLSPAQVKHRLKRTATNISGTSALVAGAGLLNIPNLLASVDLSKDYGRGRVTDAFAKDMRKFIQGQAIPWKSLTFNGGVDSKNVTWENVTWENITWDNVTWENITWENFTWENVTWENITWENVTWEATTWDSTTINSNAWTVVD